VLEWSLKSRNEEIHVYKFKTRLISTLNLHTLVESLRYMVVNPDWPEPVSRQLPIIILVRQTSTQSNSLLRTPEYC